MKIAIIGKGASALGVISTLENSNVHNLEVDIFCDDIHENINSEILSDKDVNKFYKNSINFKLVPPKINIRKNIIDNQEIFNEKYEPMSLWGSSFLPFSDDDLKENGLSKNEMEKAYYEISKIIPISGNKEDLIEKYYNNTYVNQAKLKVDLNINSMINNLNGITSTYSFITGQARLALKSNPNINNNKCQCIINNCEIHNLFLSNDIEDHIKKSKINFNIINQKVYKIDFSNKKVIFINKKVYKSKKYNLIFVCAGAKKTLNILSNSLENNDFTISENSSYIFPIFSFNILNLFRKIENFSLTNTVTLIKNINLTEKDEMFLQIYSTSKHTWKSIVPKFLWKVSDLISPLLSKIIYIGILYLDDKDRTDYDISFNESKIDYTKKIKKSLNGKVKSVIKEINKKIGIINFIPFFIFKESKTSHHFGRIKINECFLNDMIKKYEDDGIYFCGSSIFKKLPSSSPTYSIMAQSNILAKKALANVNL